MNTMNKVAVARASLTAQPPRFLTEGLSYLLVVQTAAQKLTPNGVNGNPTDDQVRETVLALITELTELMQELGWKSWKKNPEMTSKQVDVVMEEFADVLAFLGNLIIIVCGRTGMNPHDLTEKYQAKVLKNIERFIGESDEEGYGV